MYNNTSKYVLNFLLKVDVFGYYLIFFYWLQRTSFQMGKQIEFSGGGGNKIMCKSMIIIFSFMLSLRMIPTSGLSLYHVFPYSCFLRHATHVFLTLLSSLSFMTTTFVIEAMAAANAQLRWKRGEQEQVSNCISLMPVSGHSLWKLHWSWKCCTSHCR